MKLTISPSKVRLGMAVTVAFLVLAGVALRFMHRDLEWDFGLFRFFNLSADETIPTWYASVTLLACSLTLAVIALHTPNQRGRFRWHWIALALIFLGLSLDEVARIHETFGAAFTRRTFGETHGFLYYGWVIPGSLFVLLFGISYLKFLAHLPRATCRRMVIAGGLFVAGAIGVEMMNGRNDELHGWNTTAGILGTAVEESLEMIAIVIFLHTLLTYLTQHILRTHELAIEFVASPREIPGDFAPTLRRRPKRYRYVFANPRAELVKPR